MKVKIEHAKRQNAIKRFSAIDSKKEQPISPAQIKTNYQSQSDADDELISKKEWDLENAH